MTTDPETVPGAYAREHPKHWIGITAEDIPPGWIDDMVKRLFEELNRQMLRFENTGSTAPDSDATQASKPGNKHDQSPTDRERDARTLARLEGTLNRLTKLEMQRASLRATKSTRSKSATRGAIHTKVLGKLGRGAADGSTGESQ